MADTEFDDLNNTARINSSFPLCGQFVPQQLFPQQIQGPLVRRSITERLDAIEHQLARISKALGI